MIVYPNLAKIIWQNGSNEGLNNKKTPLAQQVDAKDFPKLNADQAEHFLRARRSIRNYQDKSVSREKSLDVIDFNLTVERLVEDYKDYSGYKYTNSCKSENFTIDKCIINSKFKTHSKKEYFSIITCVDGFGNIEGKNYNEEIKKGDSFLIPVSLGEYIIKGNLELLISEPVNMGFINWFRY